MAQERKVVVSFTKGKNGLDKAFKLEFFPSKKEDEIKQLPENVDSFKGITFDYIDLMEPFLSTLPKLVGSAHSDVRLDVNFRLRPLVERIGTLVKHDDQGDVFEVDQSSLRQFLEGFHKIRPIIEAAKQLPGFHFMALVSLYDAMISELVHAIGRHRPQAIIGSERELKYKDIVRFDSIEDLNKYYIEQTVEKVLFELRFDQIEWMFEKVGIHENWFQTQDIALLRSIVEIGERRNLYTHTGGRVSKKYLSILEKHGVKTDLEIGAIAKINPSYYQKSSEQLLEFGIKMINLVWRYAAPNTSDADGAIVQVCYKFLIQSRYELAEKIALFALSIKGKKRVHSDGDRKKIIINLANSYALRGNKEACVATLKKEDWSSASDYYLICLEAVKGNCKEVCRLMRRLGAEGPIEKRDYVEWPVFVQVRDTDLFRETFLQIFHEEYAPMAAPELDVERMNDFFRTVAINGPGATKSDLDTENASETLH